MRYDFNKFLAAVRTAKATGNTGPGASERAADFLDRKNLPGAPTPTQTPTKSNEAANICRTAVESHFQFVQDNGSLWPISYVVEIDLPIGAASVLPVEVNCVLHWSRMESSRKDALDMVRRFDRLWKGKLVQARATVPHVGVLELVFTMTGAVPKFSVLGSVSTGIRSVFSGFIIGCFLSPEDFTPTPIETLFQRLRLRPAPRRKLNLAT